MTQPLENGDQDLGRIADKLKAKLDASNEFVKKRITPEVLDSLVKYLGQELNVKMVAGSTFDYDPQARRFTYDRLLLLNLPPEAGPGLTFHNMGHARYSQTSLNVRDICEAMARSANRKFGAKSILQSNIVPMIEASEDERMEAKLRRRYRNLGNTYLPRIDKGWRREHFIERFQFLSQVSPKGAVDRNGKSVYWQRAAVAVRGLVAGAITKDHLPQDMPWSQALCDRIASINKLTTINEMLKLWPSILPEMVKARQEYEEEKAQQQPPPQQPPPTGQPPEQQPNQFVSTDTEGINLPPQPKPLENEPEESGDGDAGEEERDTEGVDEQDPDDESGVDGDEEDEEDEEDEAVGEDDLDQDGEDIDSLLDSDNDDIGNLDEDDETDEVSEQPEGSEDSELQQIINDANKTPLPTDVGNLEDEYTKGDKNKTPVKFINGGTTAGFGSPEISYEHIGPAYSAVRSTVANIIGPIRKQVEREFKDNEIVDKQRGFTSGRFDSKSLLRAHMTQSDRIYSRRNLDGQKSYGVYILVDISGSMAGIGTDLLGFDEMVTPSPEKRREIQSWQAMVDQAHASGKIKTAEKYQQRLNQSVEYYEKATTHRTGGYDENGKYTTIERKIGRRYEFACRMTVAIAEALGRFEEIQFGIGAFSSRWGDTKPLHKLKDFSTRFSGDIKQNVINVLTQPRGGTEILPAFRHIRDEFKKLQVNKKMVIVLTDGAFGDDPLETERIIQEMDALGVELVVLCVGFPTNDAERFVPKKNTATVNDVNIGSELGKHFRRMVKK